MPEDIRIGMIGVGGIAQGHITRLMNSPEAKIVAICDSSEKSIERTQTGHDKKLEKTPVYTDYRQLLEKERPDAVVICTPHTQHFQQAVDSLDSGAHVLLEKPMVNRVVEAQNLLKKIDQTKKVVALAYQRHTMPQFRYIKDKIASGEFGQVQFFNALQQQGWKKGTTGSWRQDPALSGGGQINDSGSHLLDIILWTTGLAPEKVAAFMDNKGTPVDINTALTVRFTSGAMGTISVVGDAAGWYEDITIWCEQGSFYVRNSSAFQVQGTDGKTFSPEPADMPAGTDVDINFIHAILGTEEVAAPPICGLRTIELTEAAWESGAAGGALTDVKRST
ncbi:MAG TPA: Gfo/Idh/MocA family oxidoreductase [Capsulimonadaceae bacterium]|nr:Gfo/Idh/MocA family oxidoreductase [Capsulimonadaceae bacterium]